MRNLARIGAVFAALLSSPAFADTVFRWVDEKGVVQYADSPPPGANAKPVDIYVPPGAPAPSSATDWRKLDEEFMERHRARAKERDAGILQRKREAEIEAIEAGAGTPVPGDTFAVPDLQKKVLAQIVRGDHAAAPECTDHAVTGTEVFPREELQSATERWRLDRCGESVAYLVEFGAFYDAQNPPEKRLAAPDTIWSHETVDPPRAGHAPQATDAARSDVGSMKRRGAHISLLDADTSFTVRIEGTAQQ